MQVLSRDGTTKASTLPLYAYEKEDHHQSDEEEISKAKRRNCKPQANTSCIVTQEQFSEKAIQDFWDERRNAPDHCWVCHCSTPAPWCG